MKQSLNTLASILFFFLCTACTGADVTRPDDKDGEEEGIPLHVRNLGMWVEMETRSVVTGGPADEASNPNPLATVGVCVTKRTADGAESLYDGNVKNQQFMYNAMGVPPAWELAEGMEPLCLYTEKATVYGYAPAEKSVSLTGTPRTLLMSGVRVLDKQKFYFNDGGQPVDVVTDIQWETDQDDYLYCTASEQADRWHPEVSLLMQHALAKVSFRILEEGSAFDGCLVEKVVLKSNGGLEKANSARLNLSTGSLEGTLLMVDQLVFTAGGDMREIGTGTDDTGKVPIQAFGLVIPVTGIGVTLELTLDDGRAFTMKPTDASGDPGTFTANWKKGYNYIYNIRLQAQGIELTDIQVAGWNDGGEYDIPVE